MIEHHEAITGRVIVIGHGTIAKCFLDMLFAQGLHTSFKLVVLNAEPQERIGGSNRYEYIHCRLSEDKYQQQLSDIAVKGDIIVNLSVSVDCLDLADWCQQNGVVYIDTAFEPWDADIFEESLPPEKRTVYWYHREARSHALEKWAASGPTAIFGHGANPGLVSHFVKAALIEAAKRLGDFNGYPQNREQWARLAQKLDIRAIHFSEWDTQISNIPRRPGEFHNTWCPVGFIEEASRPSEIGFGTHEATTSSMLCSHDGGPQNAVYIPQPSCHVRLQSWVPRGGEINGMLLPHSECITISEYLTVLENEKPIYRPTVAYSYLPTDNAMCSLQEVSMRNWELPQNYRVMNEDIIDGADELGVLLLGPRIGGLWYGSYLDIKSSRTLLPGHNATAIQVAAGVLAALLWAAKHPNEGYCEPEDLPFQDVLNVAEPYLGDVQIVQTDWSPTKPDAFLYPEQNKPSSDPWQLDNYISIRTW